ncbi:MAG TPA: NosD domain-containing protein, partial [Gemmatimonadales bacterium]|nr:NosD domain-containing protein [Gemmatimonadales bacterium]
MAALAPAVAAQRAALIELRPGLVITQSTRIVPRRYRLAAPASLDSAVLVIRGDNLTLQLDGVVLEGQDPAAAPDRAAGVAIRIEGGRNVRVIGGIIRGYKVAIRARGTRGLTLRGIDASYNWKPRLFSLIEHESLLDWLSFHHNEQDEWLRYGAAFYLDGVRGGEVRRNQVAQGMNGLLLVRCDSLRVEENTFSFNSGLGIGLYRSSDNTILRNRLDYNVRGYSHGFYRRGQDSADLLLYEQSSRNLVAYNSATHGGDGLFLWAGQSTMDSGQGGANDNLFYGNDFSFAPANAMEATFSRNSFLANRAEGSDYGLWGGYSYESTVVGNCFRENRTGIAIEHGQDNRIGGNLFAGDTTAISLSGDPLEPSEWGYPKHRDTQSRDYRIEGNHFLRNRVAVRVRNTTGLLVTANRYDAVDSAEVSPRGPAGAVAISPARPPSGRSDREACPAMLPLPDEFASWAPRLSRAPRSAPASLLTRRDRSAIVVDEWGPYDWRSPKLWPVDSSHAIPLRLRTLGPPGAWRVLTRRGITLLSRSEGTMGDTVAVTPARDSAGDWELVLAYTGAATMSPRGIPRRAGTPYRFSYAHYEPAAGWAARALAWSDSSDVRGDSTVFARLLREPPLLLRELARLDFEWYRPQLAELPRDRWALEATTTVTLPPGSYNLRTISDDG